MIYDGVDVNLSKTKGKVSSLEEITENPTEEEVDHVAKHMDTNMDIIKLEATWHEHKLGGMKRSGGEVLPVSFSDFYMKHCYKKEGAHELVDYITKHIEEDNMQAIHQMRSKGFQNFTCDDCAMGSCKKDSNKSLAFQQSLSICLRRCRPMKCF